MNQYHLQPAYDDGSHAPDAPQMHSVSAQVPAGVHGATMEMMVPGGTVASGR